MTNRTRRTFGPSLCLLALVLLVGCSSRVNPADVTRVSVWHVSDAGDVNGTWSFDVMPDNRYVYVEGVDRHSGRLLWPRSRLADLGDRAIVFSKSSCDCVIGTFLAFETKHGSYSMSLTDGKHQGLMNFADFIHRTILDDQYRRNQRTLRALSTLDGLQEMTFSSGSCLGPCGVYTLRATPQQTTIDWEGPSRYGKPSLTRLPIRWDEVLLVLRTARVNTLRRVYQRRWEDARQASLTLRFKGFSYSVDAQDSMTWPPAFASVHAGLRTLLQRAHFPHADRA